MLKPPDLRRCLMFVAGADRAAHAAALAARPDVLIQDIEDFTPPALKAAARAMAQDLYARCRAAGIIPAVRINTLATIGRKDLETIAEARPDIVLLPKAEAAAEITALDVALAHIESGTGRASGSIEIVPTCETALGVVEVRAMAAASPRLKSAILGAEDLAADLVAERGPDGVELAYARARFLLECRAARIEPIDAPYTFSDVAGAERESIASRRLGYRCKSTVTSAHVAAIQAVFTPDAGAVDTARRIVTAFEAGRARGEDRVLVDGLWIEPPAWLNAKRLIARAERFGAAS